MFAVQDEITNGRSPAAIGPAIDNAEQQRAIRKPPQSLDAWEAYQRGMWHICLHNDAENQTARTYLRKAIELDPTFGPAYRALSRTYTSATVFGELHCPSKEVS